MGEPMMNYDEGPVNKGPVNEALPDHTVDMVMITAIIQPFKLDAVMLALEGIPEFGGMTVSDCRGFGHGKVGSEADDAGNGPAASEAHPRPRGEGGLTDFTQKIKLEIGVAGRARATAVVAAIQAAAHTGRPGDGKIFVWPLSSAVRIRTRDVDAAAL